MHQNLFIYVSYLSTILNILIGGYPLIDAGMGELNTTGFMHNRVRMLTAGFLSKHLLIDWRWGEHYFARKLPDYEMASNVGG